MTSAPPHRHRLPSHHSGRPARRAVALAVLVLAPTAFVPAAFAGADAASTPDVVAAAPAAARTTTVSDDDVFGVLAAAAEQRRAAERERIARQEAADRAARAKRADEARKRLEAAKRKAAKAQAARLAKLAKQWTTPTTSGIDTTPFGAGGGQWSSGRHTGLDFRGNFGDGVRAVNTGRVVAAGSDGRYGLQVKIRHSNGDETWYAHLSSISVSVGQRVGTGQRIGRIGSTGNSFGPHLHFEVHRGGSSSPTDPKAYLRARGVRI